MFPKTEYARLRSVQNNVFRVIDVSARNAIGKNVLVCEIQALLEWGSTSPNADGKCRHHI